MPTCSPRGDIMKQKLKFNGVIRNSGITLSKDNTNHHRISFKCTSELYGETDAGGYAEDAMKQGFVPLGYGCDYILQKEDRLQIQRMLDGKPAA